MVHLHPQRAHNACIAKQKIRHTGAKLLEDTCTLTAQEAAHAWGGDRDRKTRIPTLPVALFSGVDMRWNAQTAPWKHAQTACTNAPSCVGGRQHSGDPAGKVGRGRHKHM